MQLINKTIILIIMLTVGLSACDNKDNLTQPKTKVDYPAKADTSFNVNVGDTVVYKITINETNDNYDPRSKRTTDSLNKLNKNKKQSTLVLEKPINSDASLRLTVKEINDDNILLEAKFNRIKWHSKTLNVEMNTDTARKGNAEGNIYKIINIRAYHHSPSNRPDILYKALVLKTFYIELSKDGGFIKLKDYPTFSQLYPRSLELKEEDYEAIKNKKLLWVYDEEPLSHLFALFFPARTVQPVAINDTWQSYYKINFVNGEFLPKFLIYQVDKEQAFYKTFFESKENVNNQFSLRYTGQVKTWPIRGKYIFNSKVQVEEQVIENIKTKRQTDIHRTINIIIDNLEIE